MPYIKSINWESFAENDTEYSQKIQTHQYTVYQIGKTVCPPCKSASLDSVPLERAFATLKYGDFLAEVEHVDENGNLLSEDDPRLFHGPKGQVSSRYQRVVRIFPMRTLEDVDIFFEYARNNGVIFTGNELYHLDENKYGIEVYEYILKLVGIKNSDTDKLNSPPPPPPLTDQVCVNQKEDSSLLSRALRWIHSRLGRS